MSFSVLNWGPVSIAGAHGNIAIANGLIFVNGGGSGLQIRNETDGSLIRTLTPAGTRIAAIMADAAHILFDERTEQIAQAGREKPA